MNYVEFDKTIVNVNVVMCFRVICIGALHFTKIDNQQKHFERKICHFSNKLSVHNENKL